jgi:hypothetical protein
MSPIAILDVLSKKPVIVHRAIPEPFGDVVPIAHPQAVYRHVFGDRPHVFWAVAGEGAESLHVHRSQHSGREQDGTSRARSQVSIRALLGLGARFLRNAHMRSRPARYFLSLSFRYR